MSNSATRALLVVDGADFDVQTHGVWKCLLAPGCAGSSTTLDRASDIGIMLRIWLVRTSAQRVECAGPHGRWLAISPQ